MQLAAQHLGAKKRTGSKKACTCQCEAKNPSAAKTRHTCRAGSGTARRWRRSPHGTRRVLLEVEGLQRPQPAPSTALCSCRRHGTHTRLQIQRKRSRSVEMPSARWRSNKLIPTCNERNSSAASSSPATNTRPTRSAAAHASPHDESMAVARPATCRVT